jgi:hypothetical protein
MSKNKTWAPPGWPWELDLLSLIFVVIALAVPYSMIPTDAAMDVARAREEQQHVLWAIGIVVIFVMHLAVAGATLETISTPFINLLSPIGFAVLAYYRSHTAIMETGRESALTGSVAQYALVVAGVLVLSLIVARIRMARHLLRFRGVKWDLVSPCKYDASYWQLATEFQPLIYPPRVVRACTEGVLIEGFFYLMAIPFEMFQGLAPVAGVRHSSNGRYLASSARNLIRVELLDNAEPLYISPANRAEFLSYCAHHIAHLRPHATGGTRTQAGETTHGARQTAHGTAHGTRSGHGESSFYAHTNHRSPDPKAK